MHNRGCQHRVPQGQGQMRGGFLLGGRALALSLGGLILKERRNRQGRRVGEDERDGETKVGTLMVNGDVDNYALLVIEGG